MIRRHSTRLSQAHDDEPGEGDQGQRTAAHDYPEMGSILTDRPDPGGVITVIGMRRQGDAYGTEEDPRNQEYNGGEQDLGMNWAEPGQQAWKEEHLGPQEEAPPPLYDPDMMPPAMARLAQIEEAAALIGARHHATTINGTQVDDAGDAPEHGTIPRAADPDSYDGRSTEGQGDPRWNQALPPSQHGDKKNENGATVGMYPEGMSAGGGPGLEVGAFTAAMSREEFEGLRQHMAEDHGTPYDYSGATDFQRKPLAEDHADLHMHTEPGHAHPEDYEFSPYWDDEDNRDSVGGYHEFTGHRREARVPWTGKERGSLHRWQENPEGATWGDFVPSSDFPLLGPGEHVVHADPGEGDGVGPVEGSSDRQWEEHLRDGHGWDGARIERARAEGGFRRVHDAVHQFGLPAHRHADGPEDARDEDRQRSVDNMFGQDIAGTGPAMGTPEGYPLARPEHGGASGEDPMLGIIRSREVNPPRHPDYYEQADPARFRRMMSALNVHVHVHDHDEDPGDDDAPAHEHDDPDNDLDNAPDSSGPSRTPPGGPDNASPQARGDIPGSNPDNSPDNDPDNAPDGVPADPAGNPPADPDEWPAAGADVSERNRAYTQGSGDGKVSRGAPPSGAASDPGDDDDDDDGEPDDPDGGSAPFGKDAALAMFTAAAGSRDFRFEFTAAWSDVMAKAKRIRAEGHVRITHASAGMVIGEVMGDHDTYESGIQRPVGKKQTIQHWACGCPWASFHQDKSQGGRYAGRPCSHVMALQFEAQSRGMFGRPVEANPGQPSWAPPTVVVKSWPPYEGDPHAGKWREEWRAPVARRAAGTAYRAAPAARATAGLLRAGEDPGTVGALRLLAGLRATADQANAPWGSENVSQHPPQKPYGATEPPNKDQDPGSYGFLAAPDPENWGGIQEGSAYQMPLSNTGSAAHQVLVPGAPRPVPGDLHWPDMNGWQAEDQGTFGYTDRSGTAGPSTAMSPRDPNGIRMEEAARGTDSEGHEVELDPLDGWQHLDGSVSHDDGTTVTDHPVRRATAAGTPYPYHGTVPQPGGTLAELHDKPEPALPSTTGEDPQDEGEGLRQQAGIDGTMGDAQDIPHKFAASAAPHDYCVLCGGSRGARTHTAAADGTIGGGDAGTGEGQGAPEDTAALGEFGASVRAALWQMTGGTPMGDLGRETSPQAQQPSPVGQEPGMGSADDALGPEDPSIQTIGNQQWSGGGSDSDEVTVPAGQPQGDISDVVASFQRSAAAKGYSGGSAPGTADGDIAAAARQYLAKTADVLPQAEADELVREGAGSRARNLDLLRLEGTHYEDEDDELARRGVSLDDYEDDVMFA